MIQNFKLIEKKNITFNVYEMVFEWDRILEMKAWQFVTFILDNIWWRAYSILKKDWNKIILIIKKRNLDEWGRWWSKFICELNIWDTLRWVGPAGHFVLNDNNKNKLFIWTWTGLVPLYNMFINQLEKNINSKVNFIFWVRLQEDVFYIEKLEKLKEKYSNFNFSIYISRVKDLHQFELQYPNDQINSWYTTNFLTKKNIKDYEEVYICWAPTMIESSIEKLKKLNFNESDIYFEKY